MAVTFHPPPGGFFDESRTLTTSALAVMAAVLMMAGGQSAEAPLSERTIGPNTFSCAGVTEIPQAECEALGALRDTNGPGWSNNTGWKVSTTP